MYIYLIRHGQSRGNIGFNDFDPDLTNTGALQAESAAGLLRMGDDFAPPVSAVYASPMTRALKTAEAVGKALNLLPNIWPELCETPRPSWGKEPREVAKAGLTLSEVKTQFPGWRMHPSMSGDAQWWEFLSVENQERAYERAGRMLSELTSGASEEELSIAVVTHGAFGSALIAQALGAHPVSYNAFNQYNCGISLLHYTTDSDEESGRWKLKYLNRSEHLNQDLKTDLTF